MWAHLKEKLCYNYKQTLIFSTTYYITSYFPNFYKCPKVPKNVKVSGRKKQYFLQIQILQWHKEKEKHLPVWLFECFRGAGTLVTELLSADKETGWATVESDCDLQFDGKIFI